MNDDEIIREIVLYCMEDIPKLKRALSLARQDEQIKKISETLSEGAIRDLDNMIKAERQKTAQEIFAELDETLHDDTEHVPPRYMIYSAAYLDLKFEFLTPSPASKPAKKAPEIFTDPEELANAFLYTTQEPASPQGIQMKYILLVLAKDCATWNDLLAKLKKAKKEEKDKNTLASLIYLESTAKALERAEKRRID